MRLSTLLASAAALVFCAAPPSVVATTPVSREFYWTTSGSGNSYGHGSFNWNGTTLTASTTFLASVPASTINGSLKVGSDGNIYSGAGSTLSQINPITGARQAFGATGVNHSFTSIDPAGNTVWAGSQSPLASFATGNAFGPGTPRSLSGDDTSATALAWQPNGTVWYTTGGTTGTGNVGRINLSTFVTTRALNSISATAIVFDPYTGHLFTAGVNGIVQINPGGPTAPAAVVSTWTNPLGTGLRIRDLAVTGQGHLVAFDSNGLLRVWDFTTPNGSKLIGNADVIKASVGTQVTNGGLALADVPDKPAVTSPLAMTTRIGQRFVYTLETSAPITSYSMTNLPPGLSFDVVPRAITGAPTQQGTFQVPITVTNNLGSSTATLTITVQPAASFAFVNSTSASGRVGQPFRFQVITSGGSAATRLSATGLPPGLRVDSVGGLISGTPTASGSYGVTLTATNTNSPNATCTLQLTISSNPALPVIISPSEANIAPGEQFSSPVVAPSTLGRPEFDFVGNFPPGIGFDLGAGVISGTYNPGPPTLEASGGKPLSGGVITNVQLFATNAQGTATLPLVFFLKPVGVVNISTRLAVQTGENVLIGGFIVTGNAPKKLLIRGIGPSLPLGNRLANPAMELYDSGGLLGANDDWRSNQEQEIIDTSIPPPNDRESAILATLAPGAYTAIVKGAGDGQGVGLVELYDLGTASLDTSSMAKLANISTRGFVQRDDDVMIGGFIITGGNTKLIVRAIGPSLGASGVSGALENTTLELRDNNGDLLAANDDWRSDQEQEIINSTVPPSDNRESAIVRTLPAGSYTAIVRGRNATTGVALVEAYVLN